MNLNWDQLVEERNAWVAHNFPDPEGKRTPLDSVLGCIEELGELTHHHLKQVQSIRGRDEFHVSEAKDAIGDLTVYLLGVMGFYGTLPVLVGGELEPELWGTEVVSSDTELLTLAWGIGRLALCENKIKDQAEVGPLVTRLVRMMMRYCKARNWDYEQIVQDTWNHVRQRDWVKYPHDGRTE